MAGNRSAKMAHVCSSHAACLVYVGPVLQQKLAHFRPSLARGLDHGRETILRDAM